MGLGLPQCSIVNASLDARNQRSAPIGSSMPSGASIRRSWIAVSGPHRQRIRSPWASRRTMKACLLNAGFPGSTTSVEPKDRAQPSIVPSQTVGSDQYLNTVCPLRYFLRSVSRTPPSWSDSHVPGQPPGPPRYMVSSNSAMNVSPVVPPNVRVRTSGGDLPAVTSPSDSGLGVGLGGTAVGASVATLATGVVGVSTTVLPQATKPNASIAGRTARANVSTRSRLPIDAEYALAH